MDTRQYILSPREAHEAEQQWRVVKRSIDARQRELRVHLTILTDDAGKPVAKDAPIPLYEPPVYQDVHDAERSAVIIGAGPAGLFAALTLLEHGIKPVIYERGKEVSERKKDIALLNRNEGLNPESNYCFGEGGAGTFSDGKLFSRSKKRGNMQRVMEIFHYFGAPDTVLYEAHAHIGSDKLPTIIKRMRECIIEHGGEIHFETKIESLKNLTAEGGLTAKRSYSKAVLQRSGLLLDVPTILAIGHSAHDTYRMLAAEGVAMETKGFAMGVRAEHPQALINKLMYHSANVEYVGNASYSLVTQVDGRGVYSFCMCPGGQPPQQSLCQLRHGRSDQSGGHRGKRSVERVEVSRGVGTRSIQAGSLPPSPPRKEGSKYCSCAEDAGFRGRQSKQGSAEMQLFAGDCAESLGSVAAAPYRQALAARIPRF